jgi:hypothetical protein
MSAPTVAGAATAAKRKGYNHREPDPGTCWSAAIQSSTSPPAIRATAASPKTEPIRRGAFHTPSFSWSGARSATVLAPNPVQILPALLTKALQSGASLLQATAQEVVRALHPVGVQTMRAGGSSPRLTAASTGLRPCVLSACRVTSATSPLSSRFIASRVTSTRVQTSRPSVVVDLTDHEAQTSFFSGVTLFDSLTLHFSVTCSARSGISAQARGRTKNAIAASWQPAAASVSTWKSS